jgi:hypothetical protein
MISRFLDAGQLAQGTLTVSTNLKLFDRKTNRKYLEIRNTHASGTISVRFSGSGASVPAVVGQGHFIPAGGVLIFNGDGHMPTGEVNIISAAATTYQAVQY